MFHERDGELVRPDGKMNSFTWGTWGQEKTTYGTYPQLLYHHMEASFKAEGNFMGGVEPSRHYEMVVI